MLAHTRACVCVCPAVASISGVLVLPQPLHQRRPREPSLFLRHKSPGCNQGPDPGFSGPLSTPDDSPTDWPNWTPLCGGMDLHGLFFLGTAKGLRDLRSTKESRTSPVTFGNLSNLILEMQSSRVKQVALSFLLFYFCTVFIFCFLKIFSPDHGL